MDIWILEESWEELWGFSYINLDLNTSPQSHSHISETNKQTNKNSGNRDFFCFVLSCYYLVIFVTSLVEKLNLTWTKFVFNLKWHEAINNANVHKFCCRKWLCFIVGWLPRPCCLCDVIRGVCALFFSIIFKHSGFQSSSKPSYFRWECVDLVIN